MPASAPAIRAFSRFYTQLVGGASRDYLGSGLSLPEARVVFEVATHPGGTAKEMLRRVRFEQAHLSRMLARLARDGLVEKHRAGADRRRQELRLTAEGQRLFRLIDRRADAHAEGLVARLRPDGRREVAAHMQALRRLLGDGSAGESPVRIRAMRPGDLGWAFQRQAEIYHGEFGYSQVFEAYVARGLPPFLDGFDPRRDGLWVAEADGLRLGCVAVQHDPGRPGWAKLRWYFVERLARGAGVGGRLLRTALAFCRHAGYDGVYLWTVDDLASARRQYERAGFRLAHEDAEPCAWAPWGREQRWELRLGRAAMRVRRATARDAARVAAILRAAFAAHRGAYTPRAYAATTPGPAEVRRRLGEGPVWVAEEGGEAVGTVSAVPQGGALHVRSMAVLPAARGRGVGGLLLETAEGHAAAHGLGPLTLSAAPFLSDAIRLYEWAGFRRVDGGPRNLFGTPLFTMAKPVPRRAPASKPLNGTPA